MEAALDFLEISVDFISMVLKYQVVSGITLWTVLFYNLLLVVFVTAFTRR